MRVLDNPQPLDNSIGRHKLDAFTRVPRQLCGPVQRDVGAFDAEPPRLQPLQ